MYKRHEIELKYYLRRASAIALIFVVLIAGAISIFLYINEVTLSNAPYWVKALHSIFDSFGFADKSRLGFIAVIHYGITALTFPLAATYIFGFLVYGKDEYSEWARKPFTKRQRTWALPTAVVFSLFSLLGINSFHGQNSRYLRLEGNVQAMILQGWIAFAGCGLIFGVAVAFIWKFFSTIERTK